MAEGGSQTCPLQGIWELMNPLSSELSTLLGQLPREFTPAIELAGYSQSQEPGQLYILNLVLDKPEIQENFLLITVDISTICKFIHKSGLTRQE